jgi:alcohol dehydrogenase/L-iditol 2-dehydrogenase
VLAALLKGPSRIVIDEAPDPEVGPGEVGIAVGGVGICGSDVSVFRGTWSPPTYPWVMGHEAFGTIDSVGDGIDPLRLGEAVVVEPNEACQTCGSCLAGRSSGCQDRRSLGMNRQGALAERLVVPARLAWPVGEGLRPEDLVCIEPLAVVEAALRRNLAALPTAALVLGAGSQGLLMALALARRGLEVHVTDIDVGRVAFATRHLGVRALAADDDRRFELICDTTGNPDAVAEAVRLSRVGATIIELGLGSRTFELSADTLVRRQLVLRGSLTYDHPEDFRRAITSVQERLVSPGQVIGAEWPLAEAQAAFEASQGAPGKTWIRVAP